MWLLKRFSGANRQSRFNQSGGSRLLTNRDCEVINCTWSSVKNKSKLTNLMKISRIEGYNGKYGSNPQGIREISDDFFEFHQIRQ